VYDFTSYQFRSYFRVHLAHFLVSPLIGGLAIHLHNGIPFIDAWFSSCAAMTGGSLMPYDVSKLDRFGELVLWILMCVGGVTIMCLPPACNRMYIFRTKLRPLIKCVGDARARAMALPPHACARAPAHGADARAARRTARPSRSPRRCASWRWRRARAARRSWRRTLRTFTRCTQTSN
jgi:hypothetical protein